ncbi:hypothetical protein EIP91_000463 [Steccherinum ochraceum]|uniref:Protein kinase domain-containing protein n=1 Tax=Steccherinum ochraceum TaxID=92696 RepID=A0A4R0RJR3_9APHY|nr:hypothetical protein EIP91_000463 [Steccherinum ochraceum]
MATSSAPSASRQNSRFSSLKVFKIAGSSSKGPQPPPKDPYYLANPSLASLGQSLAPDLPSHPITPVVSRNASSARSPSPSPSYSTSHYAPSTTVLSPSNSALSPDSAGSKRSLFKLPSFSRRPSRPKTPKSTKSGRSDTSEAPEPVEDPSISMPWNFQHNIHVDEGFSGLPPSWTSSLAALGFSQDEITVINARRAAQRSPTTPITTQNFHLRTDSITSSGMSHYQPRSTSLQRDMSDDGSSHYSHFTRPPVHERHDSNASRSNTEFTSDTRYDQVVYVRPSPRSPETPPLRGRSGSGSTTSTPIAGNHPLVGTRPPFPASPSTIRSPSDGSPQSTRPQPPALTLSLGNGHPRRAQTAPPSRTQSPAPSSESSASTPSEKDKPPRTPPRRLHIVNTSITTIPSPPPAYRSPKQSTIPLIDDSIDVDPSPETADDALTHDTTSDSDELAALAPSAPRLPTGPPRLSLHQDQLTDLSSWTESLFSIIPSTDKTATPPRPAPPRPTLSSSISQLPSSSSSSSSSASSSTPSLLHSSNNLRSSPPRHIPPPKPVPLHQLPLRENGHSLPPAKEPPLDSSLCDTPFPEERVTPLFNELMNMVNPDRGVDYDELQLHIAYREKENRDSSMSTMTVTPATIVRDAAVVTRARANVIQSPVRDNSESTPAPASTTSSPGLESDDSDDSTEDRSNSPSSSESHSSGTSMVPSISTSATGLPSASESEGSIPYVESSPLPSPLAGAFSQSALSSSAVRQIRETETGDAGPSIVIQDLEDKVNGIEETKIPSPYSSPSTASPLSPSPQYTGWVSEVVAPIREFITERVDPRSLFADLQEIAEGESGSVYAARVVSPSPGSKGFVAIKHVTLVPSGTPKMADLERELTVLKNVSHSHVLCMNAMYVDMVEDTLWIRMELMDRSLSDIIAMVDEGVVLQEKQMALVAKDVLSAVHYLRKLGIAHRDVRSDNLLVNPEGLIKLADFSNAVRVPLLEPTRSDPAGVHFWQAPEVRRGAYNALRVDVWSIGATVWEMAEADPPFSDATDLRQLGERWPSLSQPEIYSRSFHDFLHLCSEPSTLRPDPFELLNTPFIRHAGERSSLVSLLAQCKSIETSPMRQSTDSHGTIS